MFTRYLIVRSDTLWIQGDVPAPGPSEAVKFLESCPGWPVNVRHDWLVYVAPPNFPLAEMSWSGGDPMLIGMLDGLAPVAVFSNSRSDQRPLDSSILGGWASETIGITHGQAIRLFARELAVAPPTCVRMLFEDLRVEIERAFGDKETPIDFVAAVRDNTVLLAADVGIELVWVSLSDIEGTIPIDRDLVSGSSERLDYLDQIFLNAFTPAAWAYKHGGNMRLSGVPG